MNNNFKLSIKNNRYTYVVWGRRIDQDAWRSKCSLCAVCRLRARPGEQWFFFGTLKHLHKIENS